MSGNLQMHLDSNIQRLNMNISDEPYENLLPKFLLSDIINKDDSTRLITESSKDDNLDRNFSYLDVCDFPEEIEPILEDFNLKNVKFT